MKANLQKTVLFSFLVGSFLLFFSGKDEKGYPPDVIETTLLVQYINDAKKESWLPDYQKEQAKQWKEYKGAYELIHIKEYEAGLKDSKYADTDKYRYLLKIFYGSYTYRDPNMGSVTSPYHYFHFIDRKTNKEYEQVDDGSKSFGDFIVKKLNKQIKKKEKEAEKK